MWSKLRKICFSLILIVFALVAALFVGELAITVFYVVRDGKYISPSERLAAERNAYVEVARAQTPSKSCGYGDSLIVHPYLAYVQAALGPCGVGYANSKSLIGKEFPDRPRPRTGIILVTGGSVAAQFVWDNRKEESALERILNEQFTGDRFDRFIVLNGGHGAWKQTNQYILFGLYADILAGVITLDGVNELGSLTSRQRFEEPASNYFQAVERQDSRVTTAPFTMAALKLDADLYRFASRHALFQVSNFAYFVVDVMRTALRRYASRTPKISITAEDDWVKASYARMFAFHDKMPPKERKIWSLRQYEKYIRLMHGGAEALGIKSLFLIQPIPGWGKPLTEQERIFARGTNHKLYKEMTDHVVGLREQFKIPVYSLFDVFQNTREEIYKDQAHVNERGNEIMAGRVADLIAEVWGWPRKRVQQSATKGEERITLTRVQSPGSRWFHPEIFQGEGYSTGWPVRSD